LTARRAPPKLAVSIRKGDSMTVHTHRRLVIRVLTGTLAAFATGNRAYAQQGRGALPARPDPLVREQVQSFVQGAHTDLDATRQMLEGDARLTKATWDWGGGDFETAIGAAGHMGRRDIAALLLDRGAALDLFVAAMLGELTIVRAVLEARPSLVRVPGPHGIPLIAHAKAGGPAAAAVLDYVRMVLDQTEPKERR
jgi:hypothetical protein